jgi:hypothetical protein
MLRSQPFRLPSSGTVWVPGVTGAVLVGDVHRPGDPLRVLPLFRVPATLRPGLPAVVRRFTDSATCLSETTRDGFPALAGACRQPLRLQLVQQNSSSAAIERALAKHILALR